MEFIVNSQHLSKQLQAVSSIITQNNTVPIISHFFFHIDGDVLTVKSTDLDTTIVARIDLESGRAGELNELCVPSKLLLDILKNMDDVPLTFSANDKTYAITITSGEGKYTLSGQSAETYPTLPEMEEPVSISLPASALVDAIGKTAFACSNDDLRQQMGGIFCQMNQQGTTFVATDAHKLVRYCRTDLKNDNDASFILPRKPVTIVKNILSSRKEDCEVTMSYNTINVSFAFDNMFVLCRLVEGKYPNIEAAIPKENPNKLLVDRNSLLNTLRRVSLFASQSTHQVRLSMSDRELTISSEDLEFSNNANEKLPCRYEGESMSIGFNARFLTEMVSNVDTESIEIDMSHPNRAGILFPVYEDSEEHKNEDILMLVMPVMLAN